MFPQTDGVVWKNGAQAHAQQREAVARRRSAERAGADQGEFQLLPPAPPYYPFPTGKIHTRGNILSFHTSFYLGVIYGVLLWVDMNAATPLGVWVRSVNFPCRSRPAVAHLPLQNNTSSSNTRQTSTRPHMPLRVTQGLLGGR